MSRAKERITLQIEKSTWQFVEYAFPFAKEDPTTALSFLLGTAIGTILRQKEEQKLALEKEEIEGVKCKKKVRYSKFNVDSVRPASIDLAPLSISKP